MLLRRITVDKCFTVRLWKIRKNCLSGSGISFKEKYKTNGRGHQKGEEYQNEEQKADEEYQRAQAAQMEEKKRQESEKENAEKQKSRIRI